MHNRILKTLYTAGSEFVLMNGDPYKGNYNVIIDGTYEGIINNEIVTIIPSTWLPENKIGELISEYDEDGNFIGELNIVPIKNYKNDIDIPTEISIEQPVTLTAPKIVDQPDVFFKKISSKGYEPGKEILIDENRNIKVIKGIDVLLQFSYTTSDPDNLIFEWKDSFDRTVSTQPELLVSTLNFESESDTYTCTISDNYGTDITNDITIQVIDPENNPYIVNNIIKNGSAEDGTSNWDSIGEYPEEVGNFLDTYEEINKQNQITTFSAGTYFYHKFITGWDKITNKNQWYPRPEIFDSQNGFKNKIVNQIKQQYFRGGIMSPVLRNTDSIVSKNDHGGVLKTSTQIIDISDISDLIDGKVRGISSFRAILLGWLGNRADQGDESKVEFTFLDANDIELNLISDEYNQINNTIRSLSKEQRYINNYDYPWFDRTGKLYTGCIENNFDYSGIFYDGNGVIVFKDYPREVLYTDQTNSLGLKQNDDIDSPHPSVIPNDEINLYDNNTNPTPTYPVIDPVDINGPITSISVPVTIYPIVKTCILGRNSDAIIVPNGTRKIKITKTYSHRPGIVDLIWKGNEWDKTNQEYVSDALIVGLNLLLYPTFVDNIGNSIETGIDYRTKKPNIKGFDFIESKAELPSSVANIGYQNFSTLLDSQYTYLSSFYSSNPFFPIPGLGRGSNVIYEGSRSDSHFSDSLILQSLITNYQIMDPNMRYYDQGNVTFNNVEYKVTDDLLNYLNTYVDPNYVKLQLYLWYLLWNHEQRNLNPDSYTIETFGCTSKPTNFIDVRYPAGTQIINVINPVNNIDVTLPSFVAPVPLTNTVSTATVLDPVNDPIAFISIPKVKEISDLINSNYFNLNVIEYNVTVKYENVPSNANARFDVFAIIGNNNKREKLIYTYTGVTNTDTDETGKYFVRVQQLLEPTGSIACKLQYSYFTPPTTGLLPGFDQAYSLTDFINETINIEPNSNLVTDTNDFIDPCLELTSDDSYLINNIPIGVVGYKLVLTMANGEISIKYFDKYFSN